MDSKSFLIKQNLNPEVKNTYFGTSANDVIASLYAFPHCCFGIDITLKLQYLSNNCIYRANSSCII